jgi:hypothetical protein
MCSQLLKCKTLSYSISFHRSKAFHGALILSKEEEEEEKKTPSLEIES